MANTIVKISEVPLSNSVTSNHQFLSFDKNLNKTRLVDAATLKEYTANDKPYGIVGFYPGKPTSNALITMHIAAWRINFPNNLSNSKGVCITTASASTNLSILVDGSYVGQISFANGNSNATFSSSGFVMNTNSILKIIGPETPDQTLSDITFTLVGSR